MRRSMLAGAAGLLTVALVVPIGSTDSAAIVGGTFAVKGEFPFMVSLLGTVPGTDFCGGTLIHKDWVLTAGHCVEGIAANELNVSIGRTNRAGWDGEVRAIAEIRMHDNWNYPNSLAFDVALLRLSWSSTIPPVQLAFGSNRDLWEPGDGAVALGWGHVEEGGPSSAILKKATLPIVADDVMAALYPNFDPSTMLGAGSLAGGTGTCVGDSGGPLLAASTFGWRQLGVTSWSWCGRPNRPGGFARIADNSISRWIVANVPSLANDGAIGRSGDFDNDGRDDIVTFTRGTSCDVWVARSVEYPFGIQGFVPAEKWSGLFACGEDVPLVGDFNGDDRADVVTFTRGGACDVWVALSVGYTLFPQYKWHDGFGCGTEIPAVGDVNGDGRDDLVAFTRGAGCDVWVTLSQGFGFGQAMKWHDVFGCGNEIPATGDFNGDGRDDIAAFTPSFPGPVWMALSTGSGFNGMGWKWHNGFSIFGAVPAVGDFDADGRDDIASFSRGTFCGVHVSLSHPDGGFGNTTKWHDMFSCRNELPGVGDFNGDGRDDVVTLTRGSACDVFVALSNGSKFSGSGWMWSDYFGCGGEIPVGSSTWW